MKRLAITAILLPLTLTACGGQSDSSPAGVVANDPWIITTDNSEMPSMTALFAELTNPTSEDITLTSADCGDVAGKIEIHEVVEADGKMVMQEVEGGHVVPAESHLHMAPGGPHVMLMDLTRELPVGSEEITCTLMFDNDQKLEVTAPIKAFAHDQESYHSHDHSED